MEVKGQQGLIFLASHHSGPVTKEFQSFPFEVFLWGCHLDVHVGPPLPAAPVLCHGSVLQSPPRGSGLLPILEVLAEQPNSNYHDVMATL